MEKKQEGGSVVASLCAPVVLGPLVSIIPEFVVQFLVAQDCSHKPSIPWEEQNMKAEGLGGHLKWGNFLT